MDFNEKDWIDQVKVAKDMEEVSRLILDYPVDTSSTTKDARESSIPRVVNRGNRFIRLEQTQALITEISV